MALTRWFELDVRPAILQRVLRRLASFDEALVQVWTRWSKLNHNFERISLLRSFHNLETGCELSEVIRERPWIAGNRFTLNALEVRWIHRNIHYWLYRRAINVSLAHDS